MSFATSATLIVSSIGVFVSTCTLICTLINFTKQIQINVFSDYTKRYQAIILEFPESINEESFKINNLEEEQKKHVLRYMRAYFDLCSEEFFLHKEKYIHKKVWKEWKEGIKYAMSKTAFKDAWEILQKDTVYYIDFKDFIDKDVLNKK